MSIQRWDTALDEAERQVWTAGSRDFGIRSVSGLRGETSMSAPTHSIVDGGLFLALFANPAQRLAGVPAWTPSRAMRHGR
ncbi:hypothetical protein ACFUGD_00160 [Streptomyces sp. NPDC057217]|uniref:hypothetical protein n=1 Tax=Streptomyces sp. NPDC057217 TaxID=3346054 RepID=UPI0036356D14